MTPKQIVDKWVAKGFLSDDAATKTEMAADIQDAIEVARIDAVKADEVEKGSPDEVKAEVFIKRYWGHYGEEFRKSMIPPLVKLIRDEREACEKIAASKTAITGFNMAMDIYDEIRARSK